jgi:GNAT-family acetyltransferase (TIGR03103 family)
VSRSYDRLNFYARLLVDEARARRITVDVLDAETGELALSYGGRRVTTIESLSELTSAVAYRRCHDKLHSRRVLGGAGLRLPEGRAATFDDGDVDFLEERGPIVVKPSRGEGGEGVTVGVTNRDELEGALARAKDVCPDVVLEQVTEGEDLRVVVIGGRVVGASHRRPPTVTGSGRHTVAELIDDLNRSLAEESPLPVEVPLDEATVEAVRAAGHTLDTVLPEGEALAVRRTANVHTGGTATDVTADLHPDLAAAAVAAADAIEIPVVGVDLVAPAVDGPDYVVIEVNEQPGLANFGSQSSVGAFLDLLFPA